MMHGMSTSEPPAVAIEGVSHSYGSRQALDDAGFLEWCPQSCVKPRRTHIGVTRA